MEIPTNYLIVAGVTFLAVFGLAVFFGVKWFSKKKQPPQEPPTPAVLTAIPTVGVDKPPEDKPKMGRPPKSEGDALEDLLGSALVTALNTSSVAFTLRLPEGTKIKMYGKDWEIAGEVAIGKEPPALQPPRDKIEIKDAPPSNESTPVS